MEVPPTIYPVVGDPQGSSSSIYKEESIPATQKLLQDADGHTKVPGRWGSAHQTFNKFGVPTLFLLILCLIAPSGVAAAPIAHYLDSSCRVTAPLANLSTETLVFFPSVASLFCMARKLTEGRNQRNVSMVPVWVILIWLLPLSMFTYKDINLESSDIFVYAAVVIALVLLLVRSLFNAASQRATDRGCSHCNGEGCAQCGGGGSHGGDPRSTAREQDTSNEDSTPSEAGNFRGSLYVP
ncbi:hypothetical protein B0O99DRAFT_645514 [Bisporella sp. PMI_857]|nr:hypothetical protein B0O99DRAFT_645514 [Bisporella sp. PMI_857]